MTSKQCILCRANLTSDNSSKEHVIPNAIGGRKTVVGFICRSCNSDCGSKWDAELARQLNPISLLLGITRQRGNVPAETFPTYSGVNVRFDSDGTRSLARPEIDIATEETTTRLQFKGGTKKDLRQILKGHCRKYPQLRHLDLDYVISSAGDKSSYSSGPMKIDFNFGGVNSGRSLVKSAVALACDAGIAPSRCDLALDYLLNEDSEACFGYYFNSDKDLVTDRVPGLPFHCVYVKGCADNSTLVGYIEYYGLWRIVLLLSESYTGSDFTHSYAVDPIDGTELDVSFGAGLSAPEIRDAFDCRQYDNAVFRNALANVLGKASEIDFKRARDQAIEHAIEVAIANSVKREGDKLTDEQARRFAFDVAEGLKPFIMHNMTPVGGRDTDPF